MSDSPQQSDPTHSSKELVELDLELKPQAVPSRAEVTVDSPTSLSTVGLVHSEGIDNSTGEVSFEPERGVESSGREQETEDPKSTPSFLEQDAPPPPPPLPSPPTSPTLPSLPLPTPSRKIARRTSLRTPISILKKPSLPPAARFNFRRDILQPFAFNSRLLGPSSSATAPVSGGAGAGGGGGVEGRNLAGIGIGIGMGVQSNATVVMGNAAAVAGTFWGSAMKKLSGAGHYTLSNEESEGEGNLPPLPTIPTTTAAQLTGTEGEESLPPIPPVTPSKVSSAQPPNTLTSPGRATSSPSSSSPYALALPPSTSSSLSLPAPPISPSPTPTPNILSINELKKVRFRMSSLKVVYPIRGGTTGVAPWDEGATRIRINKEYRDQRSRTLDVGDEAKGWTGEALGRLYAECCRTREEMGIERVKRSLRENPGSPPKVFDLSNELLSHGAMEALSDLLSVDFGVKKVVLENCGLDDESLKPLLHALLVSATVPTLSLANNKRIKAKGWKLMAVFIRKARFLRYLDVSENNLDKRAAEFLVQALTSTISPTSPSLQTPSSNLPSIPSSLDVFTARPHPQPSSSEASDSPTSPDIPAKDGLGLGSGLTSSFSSSSASASSSSPPLEPDESTFYEGGGEEEGMMEPLFTVAPLLREDGTVHVGMVLSIRLENCGLKGQGLEILAHGVRSSGLKHISIRRNRINPLGAVSLAIMIRDYPIATDQPTSSSSSTSFDAILSPSLTHQASFEAGNTVTARQALQAPYVRKSPSRDGSPVPSASTSNLKATTIEESTAGAAAALAEREAWQNSEVRNKLKKQIEELPRCGSLLTLDVKGNDIRNGVVYIAQVLKRNRTLKVLNLSDNKIDVQGLVSIAEALKYNSTLETLDMSFNPCCGPGLEGITTLRAAITINSNLKRIFLNATDLSSEGAIALAEFLPEAKSLIHLDLTDNLDIDIAGVMALSVSIKMNHTIRCLDLNIPANDPDFARLSQEILQCCVRNTEMAQEASLARGNKTTITAPILKSVVARDLKIRQDQEERRARNLAAAARSKDEILIAAEECLIVLDECLRSDQEAAKKGIIVAPGEIVRDLLVQAQLAEAQLAETVLASRAGDQKKKALDLADQLSAVVDRARKLYEPHSSPAPQTPPSKIIIPGTLPFRPDVISPSFSITDSDDSDDESPTHSPAPVSIALPKEEEVSAELDIPATVEDGSLRSPLENQSKSWTAEEGEVFRRGTALGTIEHVEDEEIVDVSGEELRKEILDIEVERSPRLVSSMIEDPRNEMSGPSFEGI